ncbi:MAG: sugar transferase [Cohaesibacter sp.]|nr:sugar transferase [Cohaesibacter sp.]
MKRLFDITLSSAALILLSPLLLVTAILVYFNLGSPILFRQKRIGYQNQPLEIIKFRSMREARCADGHLLTDEERLTAFGRFLRATSIDELPSLWTILTGKMSIVGPRPQDAKFIALCNERQLRRHDVKPGLTGWAQINGRNAITWEQRFELDLWYVKNQSFALDLKIILMTIPTVILQQGISAPGHATMPKFKGSNRREMAEAGK